MVSDSYNPVRRVLRVPTLDSLPCDMTLYQGAKVVSSIGIVYYTLMWAYSTAHLILRIAWYTYTVSFIGFAVHVYASLFNLSGLLIHTFLLCALLKVRRRHISMWLRMKAWLAAMRVVHVSLLVTALLLGLDFPALSHLPIVLCQAFWSGYSSLVVYSYYVRTCGLGEAWTQSLTQTYRLNSLTNFSRRYATAHHNGLRQPQVFTITLAR